MDTVTLKRVQAERAKFEEKLFILTGKPAIVSIMLSEEAAPFIQKSADVNSIINTCASQYGVTASDITSTKRTNNISQARCTAMYLVKLHYPTLTLLEIGRHFGAKDHCRAHYNINLASALMSNNLTFKNHYYAITRQLNGA